MKTRSTKIELSGEARGHAIALINQRLADALGLRLRARQAIWNVPGPKFVSLRKLCSQVAQATNDASEALANRAIELGGIADATVQGVMRNSRLRLSPISQGRTSDQLWAFCGAIVQYTSYARDAIKAAHLAGDYDTGALLTLISRTADVLLWKVGTNLCEAWDAAPLPMPVRIRAPLRFEELPHGFET